MVNLDKKNNIEKYSEKKSYTQPQLKEIGKVNNMTKGGGSKWKWDGLTFDQTNS